MAQQPDKSAYYPSLDGLRGVAVLMVVYGHAGYRGWVPLVVGCATTGVVLFFFLSGFLMASHYLPDDSLKTRPPEALRYWLSFLLRRFVRVYPPYFFAPFVGYLLLMPFLPPDFAHDVATSTSAAIERLVRLAVFQAHDPGIYWTIKVELTFYVLYPFLIAIFVFFRRSVWSLVAIFVGLALLNHFPLGAAGFSWNVWLLSDEGGFISFFVAGALTAVVSERLPPVSRLKAWQWNALALAGFVAFFVAVGILSRFTPTQEQSWQKEWLFGPLLFLLFLALRRADGSLSRLLGSRASVLLGRVSYSLYLTHIIAFALVVRWLPQHQGALAGGLAVAGVASTYYLVVERPFVRLSKRIRVAVRPVASPIPVAAEAITR